jgi:regulatory protein
MTTTAGNDDRQRRPRRSRKPVTAARLENAAASYVARYDTSSTRLRAVLMRRVQKARHEEAPVIADVEAVIDAIVARYVGTGIINDARFAERLAGRLHRRGGSGRRIREKLKVAGIDRDTVGQVLDHVREESGAGDPDLQAAIALARRRRLGPFRPAAERSERRTRDLAALGRAGFAFDIARRVIDAADVEALMAGDESP